MAASIGYWLYRFFGIKSLLIYSRFASIRSLEKVVGRVMLDVDYGSSFFPDIKFHGFFRARAHDNKKGSMSDGVLKKFEKESEFKNPPAKYVKRGRCNDNGESMFYCSNELFTAVVESRPKVNSFVTVADFQCLEDGKLFEHRISPIGYRYLRQISVLTEMMKKMNPEIRKKFTKIDDFLDYLFHKKIRKSAYYYKLSNAVARCMIKEIVNNSGTNINQHGLIYSSMLRNKRSFNIVLKPFYVNYYKIVKLYTFKVLKNDNGVLNLKLLRFGELNGNKTDPAQNLDIKWTELQGEKQELKTYSYD
jgi:hypothetical protein